MGSSVYFPRSPLAAAVDCFWYHEEDSVLPVTKDRRLPDGVASLIINLDDDLIRVYDQHNSDIFQNCRGCVISGARSESTLIDSASHKRVLGVEFKPGGMIPFLPFPAFELHNQIVSLDLLWGREAHTLRERLLEMRTPEEAFSLLEAALLKQMKPFASVHPVIGFAIREFQQSEREVTTSALSERAGLSQTRFIQVFRDSVGLTPRQFYRVHRFREVLGLLKEDHRVHWTDIALACGYYDQAHLIHEFQALVGLTPGEYLNQRSIYSYHVPFSY